MKNLMLILSLMFITTLSFSQFKQYHSSLIKLKKPTDIVDFRRPDSYLLDSLVFNKIQNLRKKNKFVEFNENYKVFMVAQIINFTKIQKGYDWDEEFSIDIQILGKHNITENEYAPIMWEFMGNKISKGRYLLDSTINYNLNYTWYHSLYYITKKIDLVSSGNPEETGYKMVFTEEKDYINNDKNISYIEFISPETDLDKYYYNKYFNLYDIKTGFINYNKTENITYDKLSDRIIEYILSNDNMKHFINQPMIDFECSSESKCNQFGVAIDFNHKDIFITLANFNIF